PKNDSLAPPYVVAYDFDYAGIVNAPYAAPDEQFGTQSVKERVYRGTPRAMGELQQALDVFKEKKERIMFYVNNFSLISNSIKKEITGYLQEFYEVIEMKNSMHSIFKGVKE